MPSGGEIRISSPRDAVITKLLVSDGMEVSSGDPLATLGSKSLSAGMDSSSLEERTIVELRAQLETLQEQLALEESISDVNRSRLQLAAKEAAARMDIADAVLQSTGRREQLTRLEQQRTVDLISKGFLAHSAVDKAEDAVLAAHIEHRQAQAEKERQKAESDSLGAQARQEPLLKVRRRLELEREISTLQLRMVEIEAARDAILKSPVNGRVNVLASRVGQSVAEGALLFIVSQEGAPLEAHFYVPPRAMAKVHIGSTVDISVDAYPFQQFGTLRATVFEVSGVALRPEDQFGLVRSTEPVYMVSARLELRSAGHTAMELKSGFTLSADILHTNKSLLSWLLEPLLVHSSAGAQL